MKWQQFLQDDNGFYSSIRVVYIACFIMSSLMMWTLLMMGDMTEKYFDNYVFTFALVHAAGKGADALSKFSGGRNATRSTKISAK